jgi:hypothetical protein
MTVSSAGHGLTWSLECKKNARQQQKRHAILLKIQSLEYAVAAKTLK